MKKPIKTILIILGIFILLTVYWTVDNFIYPVKPVHPNYTDVDKAFAKLQFPSDWKEISSAENHGLHGRDCDPFNNSGCFHKSKKFTVNDSTSNDRIKEFMMTSGCVEVSESEFTYSGEQKRSFSFSCQLQNRVKLGVTLRGPESSLNVTTKTY